jgi:hypothetical protein
MKKIILVVVLVSVSLLFTSKLSVADDLTSLNAAIGFNRGSSQIETDYQSFQDALKGVTPDPDKIADIFFATDSKNGMAVVTDKNMDDFSAGYANLKYIEQLTNMNAMVRELDKNLAAVGKNLSDDQYCSDGKTKATLEKIYNYYKDLEQYLIAKTAETYAKVYPPQAGENKNQKVDSATIANRLTADKAAITTSYQEAIKGADSTKKDDILRDIRAMYKDLKVDKPSYDESDVTPLIGCDNEKDPDGCKTKAQQFMSSMIGKGKQPQFIDVQTQFADDCAFDKLSKGVGVIFKAGQVFCSNQVSKNGMVNSDGSPNTASLSCLSAYKVFGKDNMGTINNDINRLDSAATMNLAMLTSGTGNTSLGMAAFYPTNIFGTGGTGAAAPTATTSTAGAVAKTATTASPTFTTSSVSNTGDGITRYNAPQTASFYNGASSVYNNMGTDANSLVTAYKPVYDKIAGFNNDLSSAIVSSNPNIATIPDKEKQWATSTTAKVSTLTTPQQQEDYLRLEFSQQQASISTIIAQMDTARNNLGAANFMALYGSESQARQAAYNAASYELTLKMLAIEGRAASARLGLLQESLGIGITPYYNQFVLNTRYMYAANGKGNMSKALKLEKIKTPITLKKGWENDFKEYIDQMSTRSAEAKKEMDQAKEKIKKFIAQKLPVVPFNRLPQPGEIKDEILNMESLKHAALKNVKIIDKAMAYHDGRKNAYTPDQYSTFKDEHASVTGAMKRSISSIETAEQPVNEARDLVKGLYKEVPRADALKIIAKQMVEEGR